ncbi:hypothetical protein Tco_0717519 [Tanacetum coccineum]
MDFYDQPSYLGSNIFSEALRKSDQVYQNLMENSLALNHKLNELIKSLKSLPKETNKKDLAKHKFCEQQDLENKAKRFTDPGDGVRIVPDDVTILQYKGLKTKQKRADGSHYLLKHPSTRSYVQFLQEGKIPSTTSAADMAATWASGTQSADVALTRRLTWDPHAAVTADVVRYEVRVSGGRVAEPIIGVRGMGSRANHWLGLRKHLEGVRGMLSLVDLAGVLGTQAEAIIGNKVSRCLRHSGGGLILYQAYDNLYAMTAFWMLLEDIHVTWAHLEKKQRRLELYTKVVEEKSSQWLETASEILVTPSGLQNDSVRNLVMTSYYKKRHRVHEHKRRAKGDGRRNNEGNQASQIYESDNTSMCDPMEAYYFQHEGYHYRKPININQNNNGGDKEKEWMASQMGANEKIKNQVVELKRQINQGVRNHQSIIQDLKRQFESLKEEIQSTKSLSCTKNTKSRHEFVYKPPSIRNENDKGDVEFIKEDQI